MKKALKYRISYKPLNLTVLAINKITILIAIISLLVLSSCRQPNTQNQQNNGAASAYTPNISSSDSSYTYDTGEYTAFLKNLDENKYPRNETTFCLKDLDGNGIKELIILYQGVHITVYTFNGTVSAIGDYDFATGTTKYLYSDNPSYPGIIYSYTGGGAEHYGYMTIKDNKLNLEDLWKENYGFAESDSPGRITEITSDKELIKESKIAYKESREIEFLSLESIV